MARTRRIEKILSLTTEVAEAAKSDNAAALALFLLDNTGSIFGEWTGRISAADQRTLFGHFIGKGRFYIDGKAERVWMSVDVCFGTMRDTKVDVSWAVLPLRVNPTDTALNACSAKYARAA